MTDLDLLTLGCCVSFIAVGGAYIFIRERFRANERRALLQKEAIQRHAQGIDRAA